MGKYYDFLIPADSFEWIFLIIISALTIGTLFALLKYAKEKYWEENWNNDAETDLDDLDVEHGSVYDLAEAVATKPENLAVVLPGILLVLGLLGTFLGVGVALDQATVVLRSQNLEPSDMMSRMIPMLSGMGLTFKTSVYGVIGFLIFKFTYGALSIDDRRIKWVIKKTKPLIDKRTEKLHQAEEKRDKVIIDEISKLTLTIIKEFKQSTEVENKNLTSLIGLQKELETSLENHLKNISNNIRNGFSELKMETKNEFDILTKTTQNGIDNTSTVFNIMKETVEKLGDSFEKFTPLMIETSRDMNDASIKIAQSSKELKKSIDNFGPMVKSALDTIRNDFVKNIEKSSKEMSDKMTKSATSIEKAVDKMSNSNEEGHKKLFASLKSSDDRMAKITTSILESSNSLSQASKTSEKTIRELGDKIAENLKSISTSNLHMRSISKEVNETLKLNTEKIEKSKNDIINHLAIVPDILISISKLLEEKSNSNNENSHKPKLRHEYKGGNKK